ncbi:rhomboid family intramembrane serine protease [Streptomyces sp. 150FB]|uniref:rhomboid family intramembrane serine protease n=1 Tax=Streptomyces sp. 150FB TaxID=1576605 RepID=UPI000695C857|nr:rhomboid family intramembrane serine protease [Streptomyces sp. 150FB]
MTAVAAVRETRTGWRAYAVTLVITLSTALIGLAQLLHPAILDTLQRDPDALHSGQYWRLITPILVQGAGWWQYGFNLVGSLVIGVSLEPYWGRMRWLLVYLAAGLAGVLGAYHWEPHGTGSGSSDAVAGLIGALMVAIWYGYRPRFPAYLYAAYFMAYLAVLDLTSLIPAMVVGSVSLSVSGRMWSLGKTGGLRILLTVLLLLGAPAMILLHDNHGVGLVTGVVLGVLLPVRRNVSDRNWQTP